MKIKTSGRSALLVITGLFVCFAGPSQVAAGTEDATADSRSEAAVGTPIALHKNLRHGWHHGKRHARGKFHRGALKAAGHKKAAATEVAADNSEALPDHPLNVAPDLPLNVANAYAQLLFAGKSGGDIRAMPARANDLLPAAPENPAEAKTNNETQIVAADQLNDVDRALHESNPPAAAMASENPPPVVANSQENSTWDQTSVIGKIFIAFGALLTMASAARMFMA
jgi:hypothetical protein